MAATDIRLIAVIAALLAGAGMLGSSSLLGAEGAASGSLTVDGQSIEPRHAVALWGESTAMWNEGAPILRVYLTPEPLEAPSFERVLDPGGALRGRIPGDFVIVTLDEEGALASVYAYIDDGAQNYGYNRGELEDLARSESAVRGRVHLPAPESLGDSTIQFDLGFEAPILPGRAPGRALPAGGGEPGAAYLAYVAALRGGDLEALLRHAEPALAESLRQGDEVRVGYRLESLAENAPQEMAVTGGELFDGWAILEVAGADWSGDGVEGAVLMVREGGHWRFDHEDLDYAW